MLVVEQTFSQLHVPCLCYLVNTGQVLSAVQGLLSPAGHDPLCKSVADDAAAISEGVALGLNIFNLNEPNAWVAAGAAAA